MRKSFGSHSEVAHVWAQNNQSEGRAGNMFFLDGKIYSYGRHFCIARILPNGVVTFTTRGYSSSTGKHKSYVRSAVLHREVVYCEDPSNPATFNRQAAEKDIEAAIKAAAAPRIREKTRLQHLQSALRIAERFNQYLDALPEEERTAPPIDVEKVRPSEDALERLRHLEAEEDKRLRAVRKERERLAVMREEEKLELWRKNEFNGYLSITALRLSKDGESVETSRGAEIPVSHAKRLWPIIENVRAVGEALHREVRLGHYTLTDIHADGSIVVGCHRISFSEIEKIAKALGLLQGEPA